MKDMIRAPGFQLILLAAAAGGATYARAAFSPLQESIKLSLRLTDNDLALLQGPLLSLPIILLAPLLGRAVDRGDRRTLTLLAFAGVLASMLLAALMGNYGSLAFTRILAGIGAPAIWIVAVSMIADLFPSERRGRANMLVAVGQCIGNAAAFAVAGLLLSESLEAAVTDSGWRNVMALMAMPLLVIGGALFLLRNAKRTRSQSGQAVPASGYAEFWQVRRLWLPTILGVSLLSTAEAGAITWASSIFVRRFSLDQAEVASLLSTVFLVAGLAGPMLGGILNDRLFIKWGQGSARWLLVLIALVTAPFACFSISDSYVVAAAGLTIFVLLGGAALVAATATLTTAVPAEFRGISTGVLSTSYLIFGFTLSPLLVSSLATLSRIDIGLAASLVGFLFSIAAAVSFLFMGRPRSLGTTIPQSAIAS